MVMLAPREGKIAVEAVEALKALRLNLSNVISSSTEHYVRTDTYVRWCEEAERLLSDNFAERHLWSDVYSDRHWRIRTELTAVRATALLEDEINWQARRLDELIDEMSKSIKFLHSEEKDFKLVILDTNVYLHCDFFNEIPWNKIVERKNAVIIVPLVVVDELDRLKNSVSPTGKRAGKVVKRLRELGDKEGQSLSSFEVRAGVRGRVLAEPSSHVRAASADDEIVRQASWVQRMTGNAVLLTRDFGMQVRAQHFSVPQAVVPSSYNVNLSGSEGASS